MRTHQGRSRQYFLGYLEFTKWQKINIKGPMTVEDFKNHCEKTYNIEISMITYGTATIFSSFDKSAKDRLNMRLPEAIEKVSKKEIQKYKRFICVGVSGNTKDGVDFLMPDVRYEI